jgi:sucrose-6-phosphate hydrolase SacC (GH32 family)
MYRLSPGFALASSFFLALSQLRAESTNPTIARATAAVEAAIPQAQADPAHPIFHITAPAQWINDPNGPIYYKGYYHLFYQLHPFSDQSGPKYWGHVRSRDLAKWEHLPIALWPSTELGEAEVWSGCCTINGNDEPMAFYTSIAPGQPAKTHAEQWAAIGDKDLITWRKSPDNPVLSEALHGDTKIYEWRDPFIFEHDHHTFLVTGGNLNETKGGEAVVNIYEAENSALTKWKYRGVLFKLPDPRASTTECPNFFRLGNRWVLFISPYGKVQYFVGDFDSDTCRFQAQTNGLLDYGPSFYAPNTMQVPDGRRIVWGWVNGFKSGHGWNGCLTLPRELSISKDGRLQQEPAPQLRKLRGKSLKWRSISLNNEARTFDLPPTNTLEISLNVGLQSAERVVIRINSNAGNSSPVELTLDAAKLRAAGVEVPLLQRKKREVNVRLFLDRSVLEIYVNGVSCATKVVSLLSGDPKLEIRSERGQAKASLLEAWPIAPIW